MFVVNQLNMKIKKIRERSWFLGVGLEMIIWRERGFW